MKNSVAIWAEDKPDESHLHVNYWIIKKNVFIRDHFLDFGIKLIKWNGGKISFYFPYEISDKCITELGKELKNTELANAMFKEDCQIITGPAKEFVIKDRIEQFTVFEFDERNDLEYSHKYGGTICSIKIPKNDIKNWYVRFRVKISYKEALKNCFKKIEWRNVRSIFSEKYTPRGSFYQSARTSVDAIDFRINNKGDLNLSLLKENQNDFINLKKLHFFLINDVDEDLIRSSSIPVGIRLLENSIWEKYLQDITGNKRKYCASKWTCQPAKEEGWEIFFKLQFASANILTISWYILVACFIAGAVNISSSFIYDRLKSKQVIPTQDRAIVGND